MFFGIYDGEIEKFQKEEIEKVEKMSISEIEERVTQGEKFSPDMLYTLAEYKKFRKVIKDQKSELVQIVDSKNNLIGVEKRGIASKTNLYIRATFIFVEDLEGRICIHKRSSLKNWCPEYWDFCFGGVLTINETYDSNAEKEVEEEAGIRGQTLENRGTFRFESEKGQFTFGQIYHVRYGGEIVFQREEVEEIRFMTIGEVREFIAEN